MPKSAIVAFTVLFLIGVTTESDAQASIAGVVRDMIGAVLPGVSVEASSSALIEKTRSAVTDAGGQYEIVDLRPGIYAVTFTLPMFKTVSLEGIELTGSFVATVNAEMTLGSLGETLTVTVRAPTVDLQTTTRESILAHDVIDTVPSGHNDRNLAVLIPGITATVCATGGPTCQDVGGALADQFTDLVVHGSSGSDQRVTQNGLSLGTLARGGQNAAALPNLGAMQEVTIDFAAVSAEMATGGVRINFVPREGGNSWRGTIFAAGTSHAFEGSNFTQDLRTRGLRAPDAVNRNWDINPGFGGPVKRNALWFYVAARDNGAWNYAGSSFYNLNANNPNAWTYVADASRQASNNTTWKDAQLRLTWQATSRNKFGVTYDHQERCSCPYGANANTSPEAGFDYTFPVEDNLIVNWTAPMTSRLLLEAGVIRRVEGFGLRSPADLNPSMIAVTEQSTNFSYRARATYSDTLSQNLYSRAAVSYVTGAHAVKVGFNAGNGFLDTSTHSVSPVSYQFNNGVPNVLTEYATPYHTRINEDADVGLYAQDKWTIGRMTLTAGARYDYFSDSIPAQSLGPGPLVPNRNLTFPATPGVAWHDVTPKTGVAYDVLGDGKTALKMSLNKYLAGQSLSGTFGQGLSPVFGLVTSASRAWNDRNGNFVPDCDLLNVKANGECGQVSNGNFDTATLSTSYDPATLTGFGKRSYDWEFSAGLQRELLPRVSLDVSYFRRWYGNFTITDNRSVTPLDFSPYSITAPLDPRLPNGGGYAIPGLYDVIPQKFGAVDNYITFSDNFGNQIQHWNGVDTIVSARPTPGLMVYGGFSSGRTVTDDCDVVRNLGNPSPLYCHQDSGFLTQVKAFGTYVIPRIAVQVSGAFQSLPGPALSALYIASTAMIAPSLGRNLSGGLPNVTVNLIAPGTMYGDRINQLDLRLGKILTFGRIRTVWNVDLYNALNANPVLVESSAYITWRQPQTILMARFLKFGVQVDF